MRLVCYSIFVFFSAVVFAQSKWTMERCIEHALKNNIGIRQAELNAKVAKNNALQSKAGALPALNAGGAQIGRAHV